MSDSGKKTKKETRQIFNVASRQSEIKIQLERFEFGKLLWRIAHIALNSRCFKGGSDAYLTNEQERIQMFENIVLRQNYAA